MKTQLAKWLAAGALCISTLMIGQPSKAQIDPYDYHIRHGRHHIRKFYRAHQEVVYTDYWAPVVYVHPRYRHHRHHRIYSDREYIRWHRDRDWW
jgi:hypothetical protein